MTNERKRSVILIRIFPNLTVANLGIFLLCKWLEPSSKKQFAAKRTINTETELFILHGIKSKTTSNFGFCLTRELYKITSDHDRKQVTLTRRNLKEPDRTTMKYVKDQYKLHFRNYMCVM